mmetsp:Transcript_4256/g.9222  ORF Transcript_4256/g.9222 Transcript_4256/m.9222 type:complete len:82 (+) Transcript_4256:202-447(+)
MCQNSVRILSLQKTPTSTIFVPCATNTLQNNECQNLTGICSTSISESINHLLVLTGTKEEKSTYQSSFENLRTFGQQKSLT